MKELIDSYHRQATIPVFNKSDHERIFRDLIPDYGSIGFPALERFAEECRCSIEVKDFGFRIVFFPLDGNADCDEWPKVDVPVEHH